MRRDNSRYRSPTRVTGLIHTIRHLPEQNLQRGKEKCGRMLSDVVYRQLQLVSVGGLGGAAGREAGKIWNQSGEIGKKETVSPSTT